MEKSKSLNSLEVLGPQYYDVQRIQLTYAALLKDYHAFALQEKAKPWWDAFLNRLEKGDSILDLGCGTGVAAKYFTERGMNIVGVDTSKDMLSMAKQQVSQAIFVCANMEDVEFFPQSFHGICALFSLLHLPKEKIVKVLRKSREWIKSDGSIAIAIVEGEGEGLCTDFMGKGYEAYISYYQRKEMCHLLEENGFTVIAVHDLHVDEKGFEETELFFLGKAR